MRERGTFFSAHSASPRETDPSRFAALTSDLCVFAVNRVFDSRMALRLSGLRLLFQPTPARLRRVLLQTPVGFADTPFEKGASRGLSFLRGFAWDKTLVFPPRFARG